MVERVLIPNPCVGLTKVCKVQSTSIRYNTFDYAPTENRKWVDCGQFQIQPCHQAHHLFLALSFLLHYTSYFYQKYCVLSQTQLISEFSFAFPPLRCILIAFFPLTLQRRHSALSKRNADSEVISSELQN